MGMAELCSHFDIAASTGGNKAKLVSKALGIHQFDHRWTLPSRLGSSSLPWLVEFNELIVDARRLPLAVQAAAVQKGLIPYVDQQFGEETDPAASPVPDG